MSRAPTCPRLGRLALLSLAGLGLAAPAHAYRPFDGTDAAVAALGEAEIELGPVGYLRQGDERMLIAPALVLNLGVVDGMEVTLQSEGTRSFAPPPPRNGLAEDELLAKNVLRAGCLQNAAGPSIATEWGLLLPGIHSTGGVGAVIDGILSQCWSWGTTHLNLQPALTQQQHADLFIDGIVEGPADWPVRPVAEIFNDREFGATRTFSALVGAIWQVSDSLAFDAAARGAELRSGTAGELRLGVTFAFPVW
jgi:hypothetical protein